MKFDLVKKDIDDDLIDTVNGRELHKALEVKEAYPSWSNRQIESLKLKEGKDFCISGEVNLAKNRKGICHYFTIDISKHISMTTKSELGYKVRQYFIDIEKNQLMVQKEVQRLQNERQTKLMRTSVANSFRGMYEASCEYWKRQQPFQPINTFTSMISNDIYRIMFEIEFDSEGDFIYDAKGWVQRHYNTKQKPRDHMESNGLLYELYLIDILEKRMITLLNADLDYELIKSEVIKTFNKEQERKLEYDGDNNLKHTNLSLVKNDPPPTPSVFV